MIGIFKRIKKFFNPTFAEWLEDFNIGLKKELENPKVVEQLMLNKELFG